MFPYKWFLKDEYKTNGVSYHGETVFGTFVCGGGSTMGYKLAGYKHLGGVEIDKKIADIYVANHHPKYMYVEDIRDFRKRNDIPEELYDIGILDGSPPCSVFSEAGKRSDGWGKEKRFAEGQKLQRLDDLFFEFVELANKLKPKVIVAENVGGLIKGDAIQYAVKIKNDMESAGYNVHVFLLNSATMGVPQSRSRVFFVCDREDLHLGDIKFEFSQKQINFGDVDKIDYHVEDDNTPPLTGLYMDYWKKARQGERVGKFKTCKKAKMNQPICTIAASSVQYHPLVARALNKKEVLLCSSFPLDYKVEGSANFVCGMSVPPVMMANIAHQIYLQWLSKI